MCLKQLFQLGVQGIPVRFSASKRHVRFSFILYIKGHNFPYNPVIRFNIPYYFSFFNHFAPLFCLRLSRSLPGMVAR